MISDLGRAEAALARLAELHPKLIDLGLERSLSLLDKLGNPHLQLPPVLHIAGTNGKGSTLAFLRAMCEAGGMRVHGYTSPHLVRFHERIRVSGNLLTDRALADLLEKTEHINDDAPMTFFEITTAAAFDAFASNPADVTLLETGLGGRGDSTNVVPHPLATIITPIARDHERFLGTTLTAIAGEKAGIMRADIPCFSSKQDTEAEAKLIDHAAETGAPLYIAGRDFDLMRTDQGVMVSFEERSVTLPELGLNGPHQCYNAGLAACVLMKTFPDISNEALVNGAAGAIWPGRVQHLKTGRLADQCPENCPLWVDGAHNANSAEALAATLTGLHDSPWVMICGALNTRDPKDFLAPMKNKVAKVFTVTIPEQDAALKNDVIAEASRSVGIDAEAASDIETALKKAIDAAQDLDGAIIISGSLYLAGHVLALNKTLLD
jgi:dihydrofolate synthase/folylpolyglutamate synthase